MTGSPQRKQTSNASTTSAPSNVASSRPFGAGAGPGWPPRPTPAGNPMLSASSVPFMPKYPGCAGGAHSVRWRSSHMHMKRSPNVACPRVCGYPQPHEHRAAAVPLLRRAVHRRLRALLHRARAGVLPGLPPCCLRLPRHTPRRLNRPPLGKNVELPDGHTSSTGHECARRPFRPYKRSIRRCDSFRIGHIRTKWGVATLNLPGSVSPSSVYGRIRGSASGSAQPRGLNRGCLPYSTETHRVSITGACRYVCL